MNAVRISTIRRSLLLFFCCIAMSGPLAGVCRGQEPGHATGFIQLAIEPFDPRAGTPRMKQLSQDLNHAFAVALFSDRRIRVVNASEIRARQWEKGFQTDEGKAASVYAADLLRKIGIDYLLQGTFIEFKGSFVFQCRLENIQAGKRVQLETEEARSEQVLAAVTRLADLVRNAIEKDRASPKPFQHAGVTCFQVRKGGAGKEVDFYQKDLTFSLSSALSRNARFSIVDAAPLADSCSKTFDPTGAMRRTGIDLLVGGVFDTGRGRLSIQPALHLRGQPDPILLPPVQGREDDYVRLKIRLQSMVSQALEGIIRNPSRVADLAQISRLSADRLIQGAMSLAENQDTLYIASLYLEQAVSMEETGKNALYHLGRLRIREGRYPDAIEILQESLEENEGHAPTYEALGDAFFNLQRFSDALENYGTALKRTDRKAPIYKKMAEVHFLNGDLELAAATYRQALEIDADDTESYYRLGLIRSLQPGKEDEAIELFSIALQIDPDYESAKTALSAIYREKGVELFFENKLRSALEMFTLDIYYSPTVEGYYWQGVAYQTVAGKEAAPYLYPLAVENYERAIAFGEQSPAESKFKLWSMLNIGETYLMSHQYGKAQQVAQESMVFAQHYPPEYQAVVHFLSLVSKELQGAGTDEEQAYFTAVKPGMLDVVSFWSFSEISDLVRKHPSLKDVQRDRILGVIDKLSERPRKKQ